MHPFALIPPLPTVGSKKLWYSSKHTFARTVAITLFAGAVAMVTIFWDALAQLDPHPVVETVWPTSVAGWIGIALSTITFCAIVWHAIKKPGEVAAQAVEDRVNVRLDKLDTSLTLLRTDGERVAAMFQQGVERERKECADRIDRLDRHLADRDEKMYAMSENWVQSREDRRHITQRLADLATSITRWREEDRVRDDMILETMVRLKAARE